MREIVVLSWRELDEIALEAVDSGDAQQIFLGFPYGVDHAHYWADCQAALSDKYKLTFCVADRADAMGGLFKKIARHIAKSGLCVFDLTGSNANVCIELGFAVALGRPVMMAKASSDATRLPADADGQNYIRFASRDDLAAKLDSFLSEHYIAKRARWTEQMIASRLMLELGWREPAQNSEASHKGLADAIGCEERGVRDVLKAYSEKFERSPETGLWRLRY